MKTTRLIPLSLPIACLTLGFAQVAGAQDADAEAPPIPLRPVAPMKELLILDPAVVDSQRARYPGAFSIGHLFDEMAGEDGDGRILMLNWLGTWQEAHVVNGDAVAPRPKIDELIIQPWQQADGWDGERTDPWLPNFENAPFRLLGIVNRLDLGNLAPAYYGSRDSGAEGRLVFAAIDADGKPLAHHFTIIFEYRFGSGAEQTKQKLARQWHALGRHLTFDEPYLAALENLTRQFTDRPRDEEGEQGATQIAQVRTNDMALAETCEMREYQFSAQEVALKLAPLAQTPRMNFAKKDSVLNQQLRDYLTDNSKRILSGTLSLPASFENREGKEVKLLAGSCSVPDRDFYWETGGVHTRELRRVFSQRTCNGCHAGDTDTDFCHIRPRAAGQQAQLSKFLNMNYHGYQVEDPGETFQRAPSTAMRDRVEDFIKSVHPKIDRRNLAKLVRKSFED